MNYFIISISYPIIASLLVESIVGSHISSVIDTLDYTIISL